MTPSTTFTIHSGCLNVRITHLQNLKRWQRICLSKRM
jgi:hypothetical protein